MQQMYDMLARAHLDQNARRERMQQISESLTAIMEMRKERQAADRYAAAALQLYVCRADRP
jgi:hypothetical protein